ncbi:MAG: hypothetical protein GY854_13565 [Deltaproteobacteria bacterium]|nr:hypothetical protein [Deltaproteobacteria bacterium]
MIGYQTSSAALIASFDDPLRAETARETIENMLVQAGKEVDDLFERQGGIADISDVTEIYIRYGFYNDIGWKHETPLVAVGNELLWELPEGLVIEEAQMVLLALGAQTTTLQIEEGRELWREALHPSTRFLLEGESILADIEEEEQIAPFSIAKKILH